MPSYTRVGLYAIFLFLLPLTGAQGQHLPRSLRIGLQTEKPEIRLQGTTPVQLEGASGEALTFPAEQVLVFRPHQGGVAVLDTDSQPLAHAPGTVRLTPAPEGEDADAPTPLIRVLGPSRHYDGKPNRPYRGVMEIMPREDGLTLVNIVDVEQYLWGVVSSEMSPRYPLEALKAQAVAARTYALKHIGRLAAQGFDLDDTARCQVYGGYFNEDPRTTRAVNETAHMVMLYEGELIDALYSSTCGGFTESAKAASGRDVPYLQSVSDFGADIPNCPEHPDDEEGWAAFLKTARPLHCLQPKYARPEVFRWVTLIPRRDLEASLASYQVGTVQDITPLRRGLSGRITAVRVEGSTRTVTIEKELNIRRAFGGLRSSAFTVDIYRDDAGTPVVFAFWGAGWGHGLGMCQVGAVGLAEEGWAYDRILTHYYRGTTVERR
jgi:SpoIID/LytB domain protein